MSPRTGPRCEDGAAGGRLVRTGPALALALAIGGCSPGGEGLPSPDTLPLPKRLQPANGCRRLPAFPAALGFGPTATLSTGSRAVRGVVLEERLPDGSVRRFQHPSWQAAGNMAGLVFDRLGDVYVVPAPHVSLTPEAAAAQNRLWRIDGVSGEMSLALDFGMPGVDPRNPFGTLALTYDCATDGLYVATVAGSGADKVRGQLLQVGLRPQPRVLDARGGRDPFGLTVARDGTRAWLIHGDARDGALYLRPLAADGSIGEPERRIGTLAGLGPDGDDRPRRIDVLEDGSLRVHGAKFRFNLAQPAAGLPGFHYHFRFDPERGELVLVDIRGFGAG